MRRDIFTNVYIFIPEICFSRWLAGTEIYKSIFSCFVVLCKEISLLHFIWRRRHVVRRLKQEIRLNHARERGPQIYYVLSNFFLVFCTLLLSFLLAVTSNLHYIEYALYHRAGQTLFDKSCRCYSTLRTSLRLFNNRHLSNTQCLQGYKVDNPPRNIYVFVKYSRLAFLPLQLGMAEKNCCLFDGSRMFQFAEVRTFFQHLQTRSIMRSSFSRQEQYKTARSSTTIEHYNKIRFFFGGNYRKGCRNEVVKP